MKAWHVFGLGAILVLSNMFSSPPLNVNAGGYGGYGHHNYVHEVITPVAVAVPQPILVPAFQFQYVPPAVTVPAQAAPIPPRGTDKSEPPKANLTDADVNRIARAILVAMAEQATNGDGPPVAKEVVSEIVDPLTNTPANTNLVSSRNRRRSTNINLTTRATNILMKHCAACHTGASAKGRMTIFDGPGVLNPLADRRKIWSAADEGAMPPEATRNKHLLVPDDENEILRQWVTAQ